MIRGDRPWYLIETNIPRLVIGRLRFTIETPLFGPGVDFIGSTRELKALLLLWEAWEGAHRSDTEWRRYAPRSAQ